MTKVAVFVPRLDMLRATNNVIKNEGYKVEDAKVIQTENAVNEARHAIEKGISIIVARGYQAKLIKEYTNLPVVEIKITTQELGLVILKAKQMIKKENPTIALIGFSNMFCDMSYLAQLFQIKLHTYYIEHMDESHAVVKQAAEAGADLIIGGDIVIQIAQDMGLPALFYDSTEESIREALENAKRLTYVSELEKHNTAQLETILDNTFYGIVKINNKGEVIVANKLAEDLLHKKTEHLIGSPLSNLLPELDIKPVHLILNGQRDDYYTSFTVKNTPWMLMATPIIYDSQITGAILSFTKVVNIVRPDSIAKKEMYLLGYVAQHNFKDVVTTNPLMQKALDQGKLYALSQSPVIIYGETGTEKEIMAQCIHNNSARRSGPFIMVNCSGLTEQAQMAVLFGKNQGPAGDGAEEKGALLTANYGTLVIQEIDALAPDCQYQLYKTMQSKSIAKHDIQPSQHLDVRIMATSEKHLAFLAEKALFRKDLYYLLHSLQIEIPPLRSRPEDLQYYMDAYTKKYIANYARHIKITAGGYQKLLSYQWPGNHLQLNSFCERMILTANQRTIDEVYIEKIITELYPIIRKQNNEDRLIVYKHPEAAKIADLLEKHDGRRDKVAKELGISTSTLWRHMKKYGVQNKYEL